MPPIDFVACGTRSPPATPVQCPPKKKLKCSLKLRLKQTNRRYAFHPKINVPDQDSKEQNQESVQNFDQVRATDRLSVDSHTLGLLAQETEVVQEPELTLPLPYAGLSNLGNTCYLNAVLQVLRYCPGFLQSLANLDAISARGQTTVTDQAINSVEENCTSEGALTMLRPSIIQSVCKLAHKMESAEENYNRLGIEAEEVRDRSGYTTLAVRPRDFVKEFCGVRPMFDGYQQHDAQEFLRCFLSLVEEDCVGLGKDDPRDVAKETTIALSTSESKVRGGCKYPSSRLDHVTEAVAESTSISSTVDNSRSDTVCADYANDVEMSCASKASVLKSFERDLKCQKCATSEDDFNLVKQLFEGKLLLQTCCLTCEGVRQRYENFQDISVPVQNSKPETTVDDGFDEITAWSDSEDEGEKDVNLAWAISKFASVERLQGANKYFCDSCARLTEAEISTYFEKLPRVLTIHLKRFQTSYGQSLYSGSWVTKVTKSLHTPQRLSLKNWCSKTCSERSAVYRLFGVVMHSGMSSCSGHYLSYVNVDVLNDETAAVLGSKTTGCSCWADATDEVNRESLTVDESEEMFGSGCCTIKKDVLSESTKAGERGFAVETVTGRTLEDEGDNRPSVGQVNSFTDPDENSCHLNCPEPSSHSMDNRSCVEKDVRSVKRKSDEDELESDTDEDLFKVEDLDTGEAADSTDLAGPGEKSWGPDITKYFKPLKRKRSSTETSASVQKDLSCKESISCQTTPPCLPCSSDTPGVWSTSDVFEQEHIASHGGIGGFHSDHGTLSDKRRRAASYSKGSESLFSSSSAKWLNSKDGEKCLSVPENSCSKSGAKWLKFDDAEVHEMSAKDMDAILSPSSSCYSTPYLLFYFRS